MLNCDKYQQGQFTGRHKEGLLPLSHGARVTRMELTTTSAKPKSQEAFHLAEPCELSRAELAWQKAAVTQTPAAFNN